MQVEGATFAIVGALDAFPRRLAARAIAARGGTLHRIASGKTKFLVLGQRMAEGWSAAKITHRIERARKAGATPISENAFLRLLALAKEPEAARQISGRSLIDQSGLDAEAFEHLRLFDAFEFSEEPFGFRDLVSAKQYRRLIGDGLDWLGLVRAVRSGRSASSGGSLANVRLERSSWNDVLMRDGSALTELSGQHLLALPAEDSLSADELFDEAQDAEEAEDWARARPLYQKAHAIEPSDPVIVFNLSHALLKLGEWQEARSYLTKVLQLDPNYAEAWYNLASIARDQNDGEAARRYLSKAIAADPLYPDPVYNLALLEFDSGAYDEAARLWERYRELDPDSDWGKKARQGLQLIGLMANQPGAKIDRKVAEQLHVGR
jgi:tetratricopeptide (TPR) repeat protein